MNERINKQLASLIRPIKGLKPDPDNSRDHNEKNIQSIVDSYTAFGQQKPIVAMKDGTVMDGNGTLKALERMQWEKVAVVILDTNDKKEAMAYAIAVNRTAELATWKLPQLENNLHALGQSFDLSKLAFTNLDLTKLSAQVKSEQENEKERPFQKIFSDEEIVEDAFKYFRKVGFPYPRLETYQMKLQLNQLANTPIESCIRSTVGYRIADTYNHHRFSAAAFKMRSLIDTFNDDKALRKSIQLELNAGNRVTDTLPFISKTHGAQECYNFRPGFARFMYESFCPKGGRVFDPSMGYGGRIVGFLASHCGEYIGTDPCLPTFKANMKMLDELGRHKKWKIHNSPVEDLDVSSIKGKMDMAFTSPPYFKKEIYSDEPNQSCNRYPEYEQWLEGFLVKMLVKVATVLKKKAIFALNIEDIKLGNKDYHLVEDSIRLAKENGFNFVRKMELPLPVQTTLINGEKQVTENWGTVVILKKA